MKRRQFDRLVVLGRIGFVARALVYSMIGVLALQAALGKGHPKLDRSGAMAAIATQPFGTLILLGLVGGFVGFSIWRWGWALFPPKKISIWKRLAYVGSGLFHAGLAAIAVYYLVGTSGEDRYDEADVTALVLKLPLGRWLIAAIGAGLLGDVGWVMHRAFTLKFRRHLDRKEMSEGAHEAATVLGFAGLMARAVIHLLMGIFLLRAAWLQDPQQAMGFSKAMWTLERIPWGGLALAVLAAGLLARGTFDAIEARYRHRTK